MLGVLQLLQFYINSYVKPKLAASGALLTGPSLVIALTASGCTAACFSLSWIMQYRSRNSISVPSFVAKEQSALSFLVGVNNMWVYVLSIKGCLSLQLEDVLQLSSCREDVAPDVRYFSCASVSTDFNFQADSSTNMLQSLLLAGLGLR